MKKIYAILPALIATLMTLTFTSCDEDYDTAYTLEGTWKGEMHINSRYGGRTYSSTYTIIDFQRDNSWSSGVGYWVDYYSDAPWDYVANHIDWRVVNGEVRIYFREEGTTLYIRDYVLNDNRFRGTLYDDGQRVDFTLYHTASPNWSSYHWGYDDYYYDDYYYSRTTRGAVSDSTTTEKPQRFIGTK